jgi:LAS superfamily LD-carboxypeptidase LdcB
MSRCPRRALRAALSFVLIAVAAATPPLAAAIGREHPPQARAAVTGGALAQPLPTLRGVAGRPDDLDVLVNKQVRLPAGFRPRNLVVPNVPFVFSGFDEKRLLRRVAARPLERLFAAAASDGVPLAGVSGYRSEATQRALFGLYASQMGLRAASRVSARPGHSEHETGLAIDVTGADGRCPAESCFAGTPAARWLAAHASRYGFVVRYPADGTASTGYGYEPWHLRYLGRAYATALAASHLTYEQFLARPSDARSTSGAWRRRESNPLVPNRPAHRADSRAYLSPPEARGPQLGQTLALMSFDISTNSVSRKELQ